MEGHARPDRRWCARCACEAPCPDGRGAGRATVASRAVARVGPQHGGVAQGVEGEGGSAVHGGAGGTRQLTGVKMTLYIEGSVGAEATGGIRALRRGTN